MTQSYRINQLTKVTVPYDSNCSCVSSIGALILNCCHCQTHTCFFCILLVPIRAAGGLQRVRLWCRWFHPLQRHRRLYENHGIHADGDGAHWDHPANQNEMYVTICIILCAFISSSFVRAHVHTVGRCECVCVWPSTSSCVLFLYNIVNIECQWRKWKTKRFSCMDLYIFQWIISVKTQICAAEENVNRDCIDCWISAINLKRL